jgi:F0F1-type ATP synthase membrane subunit b/b'
MLRKISAGTLIVISLILLGLSLAGVIMIWIYKQPLAEACANRLAAIDNELAQAQTALQGARLELERTLRIVDTAELSMTALKSNLAQAKKIFGDVNGTLEQQLLPGLQATRQRIEDAANALKDLRSVLTQVNMLSFVTNPGDKLLTNLIASAGSLDLQISNVEALVKEGFTVSGDATNLLGADFSETKNNLQNFLEVVKQYDAKITDWRAQIALLQGELPGWITSTSIFLTIFLLWFAISQIGLAMHGRAAWRGSKPLAPPPEAPSDDVMI